jgi:predicted metalloenzyme YecM
VIPSAISKKNSFTHCKNSPVYFSKAIKCDIYFKDAWDNIIYKVDKTQISVKINNQVKRFGQLISQNLQTKYGTSSYVFQMSAPVQTGILNIFFQYESEDRTFMLHSIGSIIEVVPTPVDTKKTTVACGVSDIQVGNEIRCFVNVYDKDGNPTILTNLTTQLRTKISSNYKLQNVQVLVHESLIGVYYLKFSSYKSGPLSLFFAFIKQNDNHFTGSSFSCSKRNGLPFNNTIISRCFMYPLRKR